MWQSFLMFEFEGWFPSLLERINNLYNCSQRFVQMIWLYLTPTEVAEVCSFHTWEANWPTSIESYGKRSLMTNFLDSISHMGDHSLFPGYHLILLGDSTWKVCFISFVLFCIHRNILWFCFVYLDCDKSELCKPHAESFESSYCIFHDTLNVNIFL